VNPVPTPQSMRPGASAFSVASAFAATGAIRFEGMSTPVASRIFLVAFAQSAMTFVPSCAALHAVQSSELDAGYRVALWPSPHADPPADVEPVATAIVAMVERCRVLVQTSFDGLPIEDLHEREQPCLGDHVVPPLG
jgi:hypothetical protein